MDQEAFRALLNNPSNSNPSLRSNQSSRAHGSLALGSGSASKAAHRSNPSGSTYNPSSSLKPRKFKPKESSDGTGSSRNGDRLYRGGYRDRASERRRGLDGDFAEAEHLLENFQARVAAAGSQMDKDILEQQTKYLGGDERHTILVKGLDHALLERRKAELSESGGLGQATDDDLEAAYAQGAKPSLSTNPQSSNSGSMLIPKRHRDELLEHLKTSRNQQPADLVVVEKLKAAGKFKPIGSANADQKKQDEERQERKRRKAEKKKKKALKAEQASSAPVTNSDTASTTHKPTCDSNAKLSPPTNEKLTTKKLKDTIDPVYDEKTSPKASSKDQIVKHHIADASKRNDPAEEDDLDIFGDAGEYKGLDEDSTDDESTLRNVVDPVSPKVESSLPQAVSKKRRTYFEDDEVELDSNPENLAKEEVSTHSSQPISTCRIQRLIEERGPEMMNDEAHNDYSKELPRSSKLEGLSGSADIKTILAVDALQEKEEKRKAKKQKNKADSSHQKLMTDKDKLNRDYLEMEKYLNQKKNNQDLDRSTGEPSRGSAQP